MEVLILGPCSALNPCHSIKLDGVPKFTLLIKGPTELKKMSDNIQPQKERSDRREEGGG